MPSTGEQLAEIAAAAEALAGNYDLAEAIRGGALGSDGQGNDAPTAFTERQAHNLITAANALDAGEKSLATEHFERLLRETDDGNIRQSM